ncbi:MAG: hypothetical protein AMJ79_13760 [Phycisphaerae bacterium SM23_30]|nr:MAG: hypothetical protein AMJ79_13760 [Phycisphaerae bacterium SM23_30]
MNIVKSSRHSKIAGDFGEHLILYWLSKYGFECARVDHTGIDLIARNPKTRELMGISVKSRTRNPGTESDMVSITNSNIEKVKSACKAFDCISYFAIVVDAGEIIRGFIMPMSHLLKIAPGGKKVSSWKMTKSYLARYYQDPLIKSFELNTKTITWW